LVENGKKWEFLISSWENLAKEVMLFNIKKHLGIIVLVLISLIPLFGLLQPGLPLTHDGQDHVARIANFYQSLSDGNIVPRWAGNLNWGYGHPILMFLYPLPSYVASFFHFLGFGFVDSLKIVFALSFVFSGLAMYLFAREIFGKEGGILAGALYMFAPYRFVDLYVRGAIGEHIAFIFPPLILYFMLMLSKKYSARNFIFCAASLAGLVISHNAITIMFAPIILCYLLILVLSNKNRKELAVRLFAALVLGVGLSAFFLIPAFFEGKYTLRDIVTEKEYGNRFVNPLTLIYSPWSYGITGQFSVQIGLLQLVGVLGSVFWFVKFGKKSILRPIYLLFILIFGASIFIMLSQSKFIWDTFSILQKFQFPWRFLSVTVFSSALLSAFLILLIPKKRRVIFALCIVVLLVAVNINYIKPKGFLVKPESFYSSIYNGTTDTGESSPIWSIRFMEQRPSARREVLTGEAKIKEISRNSTKHIYEANVISSNARIVENTLYFPGWNVYVNNIKTNIEFQDPLNRGLMTFYLREGVNRVEVKFEDTGIRKGSNIVTIISFILLLLLAFVFTSKEKKKYAKSH
jgi:uncharacterized membrane protein